MNDTVEIQERFFSEYSELARILSDVGSVSDLLGRENEVRRLSEIFSFLKIFEQEQLLFNSKDDFKVNENQTVSLNSDNVDSGAVYHHTSQDSSSESSENLIDSTTQFGESESIEQVQVNESPEPDIFTESVENEDVSADNDGFITEDAVEKLESENTLNSMETRNEPGASQSEFLDSPTDPFGVEFQMDSEADNDSADPETLPFDDEAEVLYTTEAGETDLPNITESENLTDDSIAGHSAIDEVKSTDSQSEKQKKIKLAQIKNIHKSTLSLFDNVEDVQEKLPVVKANVPLDAMQAPKPRPDFRLDLNDRITFTKRLFGGSQLELNEAINALNSFETADEAREYLSEIYYSRNWKKSDDVAQRLWNLVENKFL